MRRLRDAEIIRLYVDEKLTLAEIGVKLGRTRERIRQILHRQGVTGGFHLDRVIPDLQRRVTNLERRVDELAPPDDEVRR